MSDAADTTHLSDAELHDVVVLTRAVNEAEALYLKNRLEESGVPVLRTADAINYHNPIKEPEIRVPRVLVARAQQVVDAARAEAKSRAIENAFESDELDASDIARDPLLGEMAQMAALPKDEKLPELALLVADWFKAGKNNEDIARYLALAGLTPDESRDLVADVYENQKARAAHKQLSNARFGGLFAVLGVLIFASGILSDLSLPRLIGAMLFVYGITRLMSQSQNPTPLTPLTRSTQDAPAESEKSSK